MKKVQQERCVVQVVLRKQDVVTVGGAKETCFMSTERVIDSGIWSWRWTNVTGRTS